MIEALKQTRGPCRRGWTTGVVAAAGMLLASEAADIDPVPEPLRDLITFSEKYATIDTHLPGEQDKNITVLTAVLLQRRHYSRQELDREMCDRLLDYYIEMLDPMHLHFLQSDIDSFQKFKARLLKMTLARGDTLAAHSVFNRFLQRVDERVSYVAHLLRKNAFEFDGEDRYTPNRKDASWPTNEKAAKKLWKQHLRYEYLQERLNDQETEEIVSTLARRYKRLLRSWGELESDDILQFWLSALARIYDPHSDYMGKAQLDNFAISMKLSLFGIGALLRSEDGYCKIERLIPEGPAEKSRKIHPSDRIIAVEQEEGEAVDIVDMRLTKVVDLIRGPKGTKVTLTLIPADAADPSERKVLTLVRDEIKLKDQEAKAFLIEAKTPAEKPVRLGVIDLPSFYATFNLGTSTGGDGQEPEPRSTTRDVSKLVTKLVEEGVDGLVLDLRRNGGGSLEEAIRLTGLFISEGPIVQVRDTDGEQQTEYDRDPTIHYDGPLIVLTSRFSASASEILAGALQDYGRALIVGNLSTHGKGTVQTIYELDRIQNRIRFNGVNPGALKVTIRKFYRVSGSSTQLKGVTPDIVLPSVANQMDVGEASLDYALKWDTIESADFENLDRIAPLLGELRRRTTERQETDIDFAYVREDIETYNRLQTDKSVSLNEQERRKEKKEAEARAEARKAERRSRPPSNGSTYEITLAWADKEGLPEPFDPTKPEGEESEVVSLAGGVVIAVRGATKPEGEDSEVVSEETNETEEEAEEEVAPVPDIALEEARRILIDLIALGPKPRDSSPAVAKTSARSDASATVD